MNEEMFKPLKSSRDALQNLIFEDTNSCVLPVLTRLQFMEHILMTEMYGMDKEFFLSIQLDLRLR